MRYIFLISFMILTSCGNNTLPSSIDFTVLEKGEYSIDMSQQQRLVRNQTALDRLYQMVKTHNYPQLETPIVDFENYDVIFVHFGTFHQGGHLYNLRTIESKENSLYLDFTSPKRNQDAPVTMALTQPYMFILIDKLTVEPDSIYIEKS